MSDAILVCIAMSLLFCIFGREIWLDWVAKMSEKIVKYWCMENDNEA